MKTHVKKRPDAFEVEKHLRHFCEASSEELANALGTVLGELDYALHSSTPQVRERSMLVALAAVEKAIALSRNLKYFSLNTHLDIEMNDLSNVLLDTVDLIEREFEHQKIRLVVRADSSILMHFDAGAMQQVILNTLIYSAKLMPSGGKVTITLAHLDKLVELRIDDTGPEKSQTDVDSIFEPYLHDSADCGNLGLTVAKALVESHGGLMSCRSSHRGNTWSIQLPILETKKAKPHRETRKYRRARVDIPAVLIFPNNIEYRTRLSILSLGGCYVRLNPTKKVAFPKVNSSVSIRILHFNDGEIEIPQARVKNIVWAGELSGVGLEFDALPERGRRLIEAIVRSHSL